MQRLTYKSSYSALSESTIKLLFQSGIVTILDFLQEDVEKLSNICKLSLPQMLEIRNHILSKYSAPVIRGSSLIDKYLTNRSTYKFGIEKLDNILPEGIPMRAISELCGMAGSGKTQLALQISINSVRDNDFTVLYVDTKGDFSSVRIQNILEQCKYSFKDMAVIMNKIHIVYIWRMEDMVEFLKNLKDSDLSLKNLGIIIIDSLPSLMFQHLGEDNKLGLSLLNNFVNYSRCICIELNVSMFCINVQTRWLDQDLTDVEDEEKSTLKDSVIEKRHRCLGKYWQHIPTLVLELDRVNENDSELNSCVKVTVLHYIRSSYEKRHSILFVDDSGVT